MDSYFVPSPPGPPSPGYGYDGTNWLACRAESATPDIFNVAMALADTEYDQALPDHTLKFLVRCGGQYDMKLAFAAAESGTLYVTIPAGTTYWEDGVDLVGVTLYFQCVAAAQVCEILAWV